jgi:uncharacterized protein YndB with AHSA1/START domain
MTTTTTLATPILTFVCDQEVAATPDAVYAALATPSTHLEWAGRATGKADGLFELDTDPGEAQVGSVFTSRGGANEKKGMVFHDRSVVSEAQPGRVFAFRTDSHLARPHRPDWEAKFVHRYELSPSESGTRVHYTCEVYPQTYRPIWLHPLMRPVTKRLMRAIMIRPHLENLDRLVTA